MQSRFIEPFLKATSNRRSVPIYNEWGAVMAISAVLQRKVWIISDDRELVPNFMVFLIGPPGAGKSTAITYASDLVYEIAPQILFPQSATIQEFIDRLARAGTVTYINEEPISHSPGAAFLGEISTLIKSKDPRKVETLDVLNNLWDAEQVFTHATKTRGESKIIKPFFTLVGGATTRNLKEILPPDAFNSGFTARLILVYSDHRVARPPKLRMEANRTKAVFSPPEHLVEALKAIYAMQGEFTYDSEAIDAITAWNGGDPILDERFEFYNDRRIVHLLKLTMVYCADRSDDLTIRFPDFQRALRLLKTTELAMPSAAAFISNNNLQDVIEKCGLYIENRAEWAKKKDLPGVPIGEVYKMLGRWVPPRDAEAVLKMLVNQGRIVVNGSGMYKHLVPRSKETYDAD